MQNASMCAGIQKRKAKKNSSAQASVRPARMALVQNLRSRNIQETDHTEHVVRFFCPVECCTSGQVNNGTSRFGSVDGSKSASRSRLEILERILQPCILSYGLTFLFALYTNAYQDYRRIFSTLMNPVQHSGDQICPCFLLHNLHGSSAKRHLYGSYSLFEGVEGCMLHSCFDLHTCCFDPVPRIYSTQSTIRHDLVAKLYGTWFRNV